LAVLITGGSGFAGAWVTRNVLSRGERAVIYDLYLHSEAISDIIDKVKVVRGDVLDLGNIISTMKEEGIDRVIHMASYLGYESQLRPPLAVKVNCEGIANILEASKITGAKRVVFSSTQSVYGVTPPGKVVSEDDPPYPTTVYGATKRFCEWLGLNYYSNYGLDFIAIRFPIIYGPTKIGRGWQVPITDLVENPILGRPVEIHSGGDVKQEWLYVKDMANTVANACFVETHNHSIFNLGSGEIYTLLEVAELVKRHIPDAIFHIGKGPDPLWGTGGPLDYTRAKDELGHQITYKMEDGIREWIDLVRLSREEMNPIEITTVPANIPTLKTKNGGKS
jgi:UDP-glucose 4-epimerase